MLRVWREGGENGEKVLLKKEKLWLVVGGAEPTLMGFNAPL
jgi:hypothetical protein